MAYDPISLETSTAYTAPASFVPQESVIPEVRKSLAPPGLSDKVRHMELGSFLLFDDRFGDFSSLQDITADFQEIPGLRAGHADDRITTHFGRLAVGSAAVRQTKLAAIKTLESPREAAQEYGALTVVNSIGTGSGRPLGFTPLGFVRDDEGGAGLITWYDSGVHMYDRAFWAENREPEEIHRALGNCAHVLAALHMNGFVHGNARVANLGSDRAGPRVSGTGSIMRFPSGHLALQHAATRDLTTFMASLPGHDYSDAIQEHFIPNYRGTAAAEPTTLPKSYPTPNIIMRIYTRNTTGP